MSLAIDIFRRLPRNFSKVAIEGAVGSPIMALVDASGVAAEPHFLPPGMRERKGNLS
jgi:hypothetical protein